jgi:PAS domain-containing protein
MDGTGKHGDEENRLEIDESGIFTWDLETNIVQADTAVARLFGLPSSEALAGLPIERYLASIHPSDRPKVAQSIHHAIVTGDPYHEVYTVVGSEGRTDVVALGRCFRNAEGQPSQYAGIVFKAAERAADVNPMVAHIAMAHKLAVNAGRAQVADALQSILEALPRSDPVSFTSH